MKRQDWINLTTAAFLWMRYHWKKAVALLVLGFLAGKADAGQAPAVALTASVGSGNVPTLTWSAPWASSCTATGGWSGTKAASGTQALPAITTSTTYGLTCTAPADTTARLSWLAPTQYADGSTLPASDIAAYRVYQGTSSTSLSRVAEVQGLSTERTGLAAGTHFFAVTSVVVSGAESAFSAIGSKTVTGPQTASTSATVRIPGPPTLTVQQAAAYDVQMQGLRFVLGRQVGEVPLGATCSADFALDGGWYRVARDDVRIDRMPRSAVIVAQCG